MKEKLPPTSESGRRKETGLFTGDSPGGCLPFLIPAEDRADLPLHHWKGCIRGPRAAAWRNERRNNTPKYPYGNLALPGALPASSTQPRSETQHSNRGEAADFPKEIIAARPRAAVSNGSSQSEPPRSDRPEAQLLSQPNTRLPKPTLRLVNPAPSQSTIQSGLSTRGAD